MMSEIKKHNAEKTSSDSFMWEDLADSGLSEMCFP